MACSFQTRMNVTVLTGTLDPFKTLIFSLEKSVQSRFYAIKFIFPWADTFKVQNQEQSCFKKNTPWIKRVFQQSFFNIFRPTNKSMHICHAILMWHYVCIWYNYYLHAIWKHKRIWSCVKYLPVLTIKLW